MSEPVVMAPPAPASIGPGFTTVEQVLARLRDAECDHGEQRQLVLLLEVMPFEEDVREEACQALREFIANCRDSEDTRDLVAVGAAIRKLVLNLRPEELDSVSWLLEAGHGGSPSLDVELEAVKSVVWNLKAQPPRHANAYPNLADRLREMANDYLKDRFLPREKYSPTAINVVLALLLMRSHVAEVVNAVRQLRLAWFKELVARRALSLKHDLQSRRDKEGVAEAIDALEAMQEFAHGN